LAGFQGESSLRTWLLGIARHKIDDVFRQRLRLADSIEDTDAVVDTSPAITLDDRIDAERDRVKAQRVLAQLPERYALMLLRRYWERRRTRDIAAELGATEKSVERTLARARARFKQLWLKEQL
jgi:RNA polymerase sigma-70 factor (ECF subfamily)